MYIIGLTFARLCTADGPTLGVLQTFPYDEVVIMSIVATRCIYENYMSGDAQHSICHLIVIQSPYMGSVQCTT